MDNGESKRVTKKIKAYGIVQGVGFRPLVYRIAKKLGIAGTVRNVGGCVEIIAQADEEAISLFRKELEAGADSVCEIVRLEVEELPCPDYKDFIIINSKDSEEISIPPPDLPVCPKCLEELYDEKNRRYHNPFISCISCGPRYTILEDLPYDRHTTVMKDFEMCSSCREEYTSPGDRRFHAQTISCDDCGPYLIFHDNRPDRTDSREKDAWKPGIYGADISDENQRNSRREPKEGFGEEQTESIRKELKESIREELKESIEEELKEDIGKELLDKEAFDRAVSLINAGAIIAVKGIGGYHFVCSPFMEETVQRLRGLKGREEKPFAVMFETIRQLEEYCTVSREEKALLETRAKPIVLLYMHKDGMAPSTNKGSVYCGAFLPHTPLQQLLTGQCGPLIMTSANLSDRPVIREDEAMLSLKSPYLEGVLYHKRRIIRSVDDSVAKVIDGKPQLIRRSRGYVPYPVFLEQGRTQGADNEDKTCSAEKKNTVIFAAGGDLKAAFCLYKNGAAVVSQHFGDLEEVSVMEEYQKSFPDLSRLLKMQPALAVCDLHPNYFSSRFTKALGLPVLMAQHHHAHIASVLAEHDLREKVIGVAFDGTGYGTDGNIWGGEFLVCEGAQFIRAAQLGYTPMLGGDESMRDALKTATCFLISAGLEEYVRDDRAGIIKAALRHGINTVLSSSTGRLFDAAASILRILQVNRYEGECAAFLEREAVLARRSGKQPEELSFAFREKSEIIEIEPRPVLEALCRLRETVDIGSLAIGFHYALAEAVGVVCERLRDRFHSNTVALSGGVFQNTVLSERTLEILRKRGFRVYVNLAVPPNDGGISLGQAYIALKSLENQG
jgi:hydrogenase maturation protein HypF